MRYEPFRDFKILIKDFWRLASFCRKKARVPDSFRASKSTEKSEVFSGQRDLYKRLLAGISVSLEYFLSFLID